MPTYRWTGDGTFTDADRNFTATPGSEHDLTDEQTDEYAAHPLFGDDWKVSDDKGSDADDDTDEDADEDADATETASGGETDTEGETDGTTGRGTTGDTAEDTDLEALSGVGPAKADGLRAAGYETLTGLQAADESDLAAVDGISDDLAADIAAQVG